MATVIEKSEGTTGRGPHVGEPAKFHVPLTEMPLPFARIGSTVLRFARWCPRGTVAMPLGLLLLPELPLTPRGNKS